MSLQQMTQNPMMKHLINALERGEDIGHYGRLVFIMVARHFMDEEEIVTHLTGNGGLDEKQARGLFLQVEQHGYNPPRPEKIRSWQAQQDFPICPDADNPDGCNLYQDLDFPEEVYSSIAGYYQKKAES